QILKDMTLFFSHSMPNLTIVIPAMGHIDHVFTSAIIKKEHLDPAIYAGLRLAKRTLNHYYLLTDTFKAYCIAMVLHPHHKLAYFRSAGWPQEWIHT
ncbi:hypothetical protein EDD22DRAFT_733592, partial [Suillus occidentalis]